MTTASNKIVGRGAAVGRRIDAVVVGASAGGIDAMLAIFSGLPESYSLPIIAVLHMAENPDSRLAEMFQHRIAMRVKHAEDKEDIVAGILYFAVPGYHLSIEKDFCFSLSCEPPVNYSRPAIDLLMESAADAYGDGLVGILLTGASHDGAAGLNCIKRYGGVTVVQDPEEANISTMPLEAMKLHSPDYVLRLDQIHQLLLTLEIPNAKRKQH